MKVEFLSVGIDKAMLLERVIAPNVDTAKILVRLAHDIELMDMKSYLRAEDELNQIGKMLGAWMKNANQAKSPR